MQTYGRILLVSPTVPETQEYSRATFRSLRRYTSYPDYTLFWAANRQTPESLEFLTKECADSATIIDPTSADRGCGGGWNVGVEHALKNGYDYVMLFTNDTLFAEDWLTSLMKFVLENPEVGCTSPLWHWAGNPTCDITDDMEIGKWNDWYSKEAKRYTSEKSGTIMVGMQGCFFVLSTALIRELESSENTENIPGRFDVVSFPIAYWEDADILLRVWRAKKKCRVYHGSVLHHFGAKTLSDPRYHQTANRLYLQNQMSFYRKWNCLDRVGLQFMVHNSITTFNQDSLVLLHDGVYPTNGPLGDFLLTRDL